MNLLVCTSPDELRPTMQDFIAYYNIAAITKPSAT